MHTCVQLRTYTQTHPHTHITRARARLYARGWAEGLILSSVIVAGQRHLCEEQTYLAQQAIHQIAGSRERGMERERESDSRQDENGTEDEREKRGTEASREKNKATENAAGAVVLVVSRQGRRAFVLERAKFFRPKARARLLLRPELRLEYTSRLS